MRLVMSCVDDAVAVEAANHTSTIDVVRGRGSARYTAYDTRLVTLVRGS